MIISCKEEPYNLTRIEGKRIEINDSISPKQDIETFIEPYKNHIEKDLDSVIAYAMDTYTKSNGELNTAIGNFMVDVVYEQANPIFNSRAGKDIDMVLLNHGGIRSIIPKGNLRIRNVFELMPFENKIVVVALKGKQIDSMITYLSKAKRAHPFSKLKLTLDKNFEPISASIKGKTIDVNKTYYVATSDYLYNNGDNMRFFRPNDSLYDLNYKIRNALIDYLKKVDTINPVIDDRFIQIKK
ncbi:5'-nucleotidase C-terminal domain-containing protein [Aestuariivivens insulae]|uniref:5'-nucleotidase C-terminal domain-containing protein n=1 Tax=Aestuariivivens insulae TaxID=1621988 RepID=UPI001F5B0006|nr:5'-nucleotidase [Aestuariivivens insulae]